MSLSKCLRKESYRLSSFTEFPDSCSVSVPGLARNGFSWTQQGDKVKCFQCDVVIDRWKAGDDPSVRHRQSSPRCPLVAGTDRENIPMVPLTPGFLVNMPARVKGSFIRNEPTRGRDATDTVTDGPESEFLQTCSHAVRRAVDHGVITAGRTPAGHLPFQQNGSIATVADSQRTASAQRDSWRAGDVLANNSPAPAFDPNNPDFDLLRHEAARLATYTNWPALAPVQPAELAKNGFVYTGQGDRVRCTYCRNFLKNWARGDEAASEHRRHFPDCPFVRGRDVNNVPIENDFTGNYTQTARKLEHEARVLVDRDSVNNSYVETTQQTFASLLFDPNNPPKHREFADPAVRRQTFLVSGAILPNGQDINILVEAGFYLVGPHDNVKCFYCDVGLKNFQSTDNPWLEHAKWFPRCPYVIQRKGKSFIQQAQTERDLWLRNNAGQAHVTDSVPDLTPADNTSTSLVGRSSIDNTTLTDDNTTSAVGHGAQGATQGATARARPTGRKNTKKHAGKLMEADFEPTAAKNIEEPQDVVADNAEDTDSEAEQLLEENRQLKEARTCKVCVDKEVNVVFLPCGHLVCCDDCAPALRNCAICRSLIRGTVKIFLS